MKIRHLPKKMPFFAFWIGGWKFERKALRTLFARAYLRRDKYYQEKSSLRTSAEFQRNEKPASTEKMPFFWILNWRLEIWTQSTRKERHYRCFLALSYLRWDEYYQEKLLLPTSRQFQRNENPASTKKCPFLHFESEAENLNENHA